MEQNNVQILLFQQIKSLVPAQLSVVDEIAAVLDISTDSAYRRIRGEKPISLDELQKLCSRYHISADRFLNLKSNGFVFTGNLGQAAENFEEVYLNNMLQQFEFMCSHDHRHIYFLPNDIPPFVYFQIPELAAFTFFYYKKSLLHFEEMNNTKFSVGQINDEQAKLGSKVQQKFNQIASTEIWGIDTINSVLRHIAFYRDMQIFESKDDIACLYDKLEVLMNHLEKQAEAGLKFDIGQSPGKNAAVYQLYHNDLISGDNCALAEIGDKRITYISHNLISFMYTRDEDFNNYTLNTFRSAIGKSTQISLIGEKERAKFFTGLRKKIQQQKEMINQY
ncbi:MAG: hypothetical protein IPL84_13085 [Chitinophagaceae bacterium]|nr:hypothetical protein [Chitinophagaceae bacterium]